MRNSHPRIFVNFLVLIFFTLLLYPLAAQEQDAAPDGLSKLVLSNFGSYDAATKKASISYARLPQAQRGVIESALLGVKDSTNIESHIAAWFSWKSEGKAGYLVLVSTSSPSLELASPTIGVAMSWFFCDNAQKIVLRQGRFYAIEGSYGQAPEFSKLSLTTGDDALLKSSGLTQMGFVQTYNELAVLDSKGLSSILSYQAFDSNLGNVDEDSPHRAYEYDSRLELDKVTGKSYPDLLISFTGTRQVDDFGYKEAIVPAGRTDRYRYVTGKYILASSQAVALKDYTLPTRILIENLTQLVFEQPADSELSQPIFPIGWSNNGKFAVARVEYSFDPMLPAPDIRLEIFDVNKKTKIHDGRFSFAELYNRGILDGGDEVDENALAFEHSGFKAVLKQHGIIQSGYEPALALSGLSAGKLQGFGFVSADQKSALKIDYKTTFVPATDNELSANYTDLSFTVHRL